MLINDYKASPWHKSLLKDLFFIARYLFLFVRNGFQVRTILFYPEFPLYKTVLNRYLLGTQYNITNNPKLKFDLVVAWEDCTHRPRHPLLDQLGREYEVINLHCSDISKKRVEQASLAVFGYGLFVDPVRHHGPCVSKYDDNGRHDQMEIVECPIEKAETGRVYQRLIDNHYDERRVYDLRVQICGGQVYGVNLRIRWAHSRFSGDSEEYARSVGDYFSREEVSYMLALAREMGLDYGEIDTLRDRRDQRLYVVDVNNTPQNTASDVYFPRGDRARYIGNGRRAFREQYLHPLLFARRNMT